MTLLLCRVPDDGPEDLAKRGGRRREACTKLTGKVARWPRTIYARNPPVRERLQTTDVMASDATIGAALSDFH